MKRLCYGIIVCVLCLSLAACKTEEEKTIKPVQDAWTLIMPGEGRLVNSFTMDEEGNAYVLVAELKEGEILSLLEMYDAKGERVFSKEYASVFGKSADLLPAMAAKDGMLYLITNCAEDESYIELREEVAEYYEEHGEYSEEVLEKAKKATELENNQKICATLFSYRIETGEVIRMKAFPAFNRVSRMLVGAGEFYLLGAKLDMNTAEGSDVAGQESILRYSVATGEESMLGIDKPLDIALNQAGNLVIHAEMEDGNYFLEYNAEKKAVKMLASSENTGIGVFGMGEGDSIVYPAESYEGMLWSDFSKLTEGTELYPFAVWNDKNMTCVNGRVICRAENDRLVIISMADVKKENRYIRFITKGNTLDNSPYSCGYQIEQKDLEQDKLALKVLAMDKDYDLCLIDSRYGFSHNVRENGNFYALNELNGIEQYLERCFPYVREAATKEDGSIWMLPIQVNIPLMIYDTAMDECLSIPFTADMTYDEFFSAQEALSDEDKKLTEWLNLKRYFLLQYVNRNHSVDTEEFREVSRLLAEKESLLKKSASSLPYRFVYTKGDYIYKDVGILSTEWIYRNRALYGEDAVAYAYPRGESMDKNVATCTFFVVNPASDNLEATLEYLESYIAYMLHMERSPAYFQTLDEDADMLDASLHEVYKNGEIVFALDEELTAGYDDVLAGKKDLEEYIQETERKLSIYFHE